MKRQTEIAKPDWVPRQQMETLVDRVAQAEDCCKQLIRLINPDILAECDGDWLTATQTLLESE